MEEAKKLIEISADIEISLDCLRMFAAKHNQVPVIGQILKSLHRGQMPLVGSKESADSKMFFARIKSIATHETVSIDTVPDRLHLITVIIGNGKIIDSTNAVQPFQQGLIGPTEGQNLDRRGLFHIAPESGDLVDYGSP